MLDNNKYFNQEVITSEDVQNKLAPYLEGIDIYSIVESINKDINENHETEETFFGSLTLDDYQINYIRDFIPWNAAFVCEKWAKMKYSKIIIRKGDTVVILVGTDNTIQALRKTENQKMTLEINFDLKSKTMDLQEKGNNTNRLTFGKKSV
ncbi:MAG: hypothetical protein IJ743_00630 [Bacilli bacterium]|nr:hypothetical protein [Bacilli bacterium]MBR1817312.1 hypothetical protein [Bacilli bacterium]